MGVIKSAIFGTAKVAAHGLKSKKTVSDEINDLYKNHQLITKVQSDDVKEILKHAVHIMTHNNAQLSNNLEAAMKANMEMAKVVLDIVKNIHGM